MSFADRAAASAGRLVSHFSGGTTITIRSSAGTFDPSDRSVTPSGGTMTLVCTYPTPYGSKLVDGERIRANDLRVLIRQADPARTFEPRPDQLATIGSSQYRIVCVDPQAGADELQLRGVA